MPDTSRSWYRVGHSTNVAARTGCSVILFDQLTQTLVDVRGGAPGTRETDLLQPGRLVGSVDAILFTGGSVFGLGAADGVVRFLAERGRGFPTSVRPVPIVPAAVIFDLSVGQPEYPSIEDGYQAASAASDDDRSGRIGAGIGATVAKLGGAGVPAGIGIATVNTGQSIITAVVVLNAVGDIIDPATGRRLAATTDPEDRGRTGREIAIAGDQQARIGENTTIGAVLISTPTSRDGLYRCCVAAHAALARCVVPAHTMFDGDTFFVSAPDVADIGAREVMQVAAATEVAVERAIVSLFDPDDSASAVG